MSRLRPLRALRAWLPALIWMAIIFWLSSQSTLTNPAPGLDDKVLEVTGHLVEYGVLALLLYYPLRQRDMTPRTVFAVALIGAVLYGISDEWHQSFVPNRTPSVFDLLVDTIGATLALTIVSLWQSDSIAFTSSNSE